MHKEKRKNYPNKTVCVIASVNIAIVFKTREKHNKEQDIAIKMATSCITTLRAHYLSPPFIFLP